MSHCQLPEATLTWSSLWAKLVGPQLAALLRVWVTWRLYQILFGLVSARFLKSQDVITLLPRLWNTNEPVTCPDLDCFRDVRIKS